MDSGGCHHFPGENGTGVSIHVNRGDFRRNPISNDDPRVPLSNLSVLRQRMDSLQLFLSQSVGRKTLLGKGQMDMVNAEITSAIQQIIVNGTALLAFSQSQQSLGSQIGGETVVMNRNEVDQAVPGGPVSSIVGGETVAADLTGLSSGIGGSDPVSSAKSVHMSYPNEEKAIDFGKFRENQLDFKSRSWNSVKIDENLIDIDDFRENQSDFNSLMSSWEYEEVKDGGDSKEEEMKSDLNDGGCEVVEIDAVELLAEHVHFCDICGKGFKRDANLRMHMRAHGNQFKTPEALAKPDCAELHRKTRFSCPYVGCNRNKSHKKFQPLKSVICVKNHFKRSHCPKMYSCNRCHKKSFSVVSDLKSHFKHCGESKWRCSCGTTFSRKDKLFGHLALFEGHMPEEDEKSKGAVDMDEDEEKVILNNQLEGDSAANGPDLGFFDGLFDGFGGIDNNYLKDVFGSPLVDTRMGELYDLP